MSPERVSDQVNEAVRSEEHQQATSLMAEFFLVFGVGADIVDIDKASEVYDHVRKITCGAGIDFDDVLHLALQELGETKIDGKRAFGFLSRLEINETHRAGVLKNG